MSRERKPKRLTWTDEAGNTYTDNRRTKLPSTLGAIPRRKRLVDVQHGEQHHLASLVRNGSAPPLLYTQGPNGPVPTCALVPAGLVNVVTVVTDDLPRLVPSLGDPRPVVEITCPDCRRSCSVPAARIRDAVPIEPTTRAAVIRVGP